MQKRSAPAFEAGHAAAVERAGDRLEDADDDHGDQHEDAHAQGDDEPPADDEDVQDDVAG